MAEQEKQEVENHEYKDWLNEIRKIRGYSSEQFDKLIVYLSSGALVLTMGFVKDIVKINENTDKSLLVTSWILYASALILILISHKTSIKAMDLELNNKEKFSDIFDIITDMFNWFSVICLLIGIITFVLFIKKHL